MDVLEFLKDFWDKLAKLVYKVFLPAMIFNSLLATQWKTEYASFALATVIGSIIALLVSLLFARLLLSRLAIDTQQRRTLISIVFQPNCAFLGFPLIEGVVGKDGMAFASIFATVEWPIVIIATLIVLQGWEASPVTKLKEIAREPLMIAIMIGIPISLLGLSVPEIIRKPIAMGGSLAGPLALIVVGARLAIHDMQRHTAGIVWASAVKLVAIPSAMYFIAQAMGLSGVSLNVFVLLMATPIAAGMTIIVGANDGDVELCANATSVSTIASLATLIAIATLLT